MSTAAAQQRRAPPSASAIRPERPDRGCRATSDQRPGADPARRSPSSCVAPRARPAAELVESPRRSCRKRTRKPTEADLRRDQERAADRQPPDRAGRETARGRRRCAGGAGVRALANHEPADHRPGEAGEAERREAPLARRPAPGSPAAPARPRSRSAGWRSAGCRARSPRRSRRNQCRTARPLAELHARASSTRRAAMQPEERPEASESATRRRRGDAAHAEPGHEHESLPEPVGRDPPRDRASIDRADERAGEQQPRSRPRREVVTASRSAGAITATPNQIAE